uniref:Uncharacterized protein n=1 Tax=Favella ehrenbergii TaxID=182087 RepID=A0A7S3I0F5_9SPIT
MRLSLHSDQMARPFESEDVLAAPDEFEVWVLGEAVLLRRVLLIRMEQEDKVAAWAQQESCHVQQMLVELSEIELLSHSVPGLVRVLLPHVHFNRLGLLGIANSDFLTARSHTVGWIAYDSVENWPH